MPAMNETHTFAGLSQKALSSGRPCFVGVRISDSTFVRDVVKGSAYRAIACKDPHLQFGVQSPQLQTLTAAFPSQQTLSDCGLTVEVVTGSASTRVLLRWPTMWGLVSKDGLPVSSCCALQDSEITKRPSFELPPR